MFEKCSLVLVACLLAGCGNHQGVPEPKAGIQTGEGNPGATPNQGFTVTNPSGGTSIPREGGNLDRGVTRENDPSRNAPGPDGTALAPGGAGAGSSTK